jgi:hypothetical protein
MGLFVYTVEFKQGEHDKTVQRRVKDLTFLFKGESNSTATFLQ